MFNVFYVLTSVQSRLSIEILTGGPDICFMENNRHK